MYQFIIRGARGTIPACGQEYLIYGGHTTCFTVRTDSGLIIFDAGTGISSVANDLSELPTSPSITLLFTHFHMDHIIGLPIFSPLYNKNTEISILADRRRTDDWRTTLKNFIGKPYWPIGLAESDAVMKLEDIPVDEEAMELYGVRISWFLVPHPQQCLAYRVEMPENTVVIATDLEYNKNGIQSAFINFCRNADFLIFDAHYTPEEYPAHRGWGHSTWEVGARIANEAGVDRLILTHHAPSRKDTEIDRILEAARKVFPVTFAAAENMVLERV